MKVLSAVDAGGDVLVVTGEADTLLLDGAHDTVQARGWVSAITTHYEPDAYDAEGHLRAEAEPRRMTQQEIADYCLRLLQESAGVAPAAGKSFI